MQEVKTFANKRLVLTMPAHRSFSIHARYKSLVVVFASFCRSGRWHGRTSAALAISPQQQAFWLLPFLRADDAQPKPIKLSEYRKKLAIVTMKVLTILGACGAISPNVRRNSTKLSIRSRVRGHWKSEKEGTWSRRKGMYAACDAHRN